MTPDFSELRHVAQVARRDALTMIHRAGSGHPGGSLSVMDLLVWLYLRELRFRADQPDWAGRDRLVLSKGHACPALYAVAAHVGLLPRADLASFRRIDGRLQGHPHVGTTAFAETSTGSLGQGFSTAVGMALGLRQQKIDARAYAVLGDGELQEGEIWEGAMFAAHHRLHALCAVLDYNKLQSDDTNAAIMGLEPLVDKWRAFGWHVLPCDGHDFEALSAAFTAARAHREAPSLVLAHTIKGKGVGYMEGVPSWHGSVKMSDEDLRLALADLGVAPQDMAHYFGDTVWEAR